MVSLTLIFSRRHSQMHTQQQQNDYKYATEIIFKIHLFERKINIDARPFTKRFTPETHKK